MPRAAGDESRGSGFFRVVTLLVILWGLGSGVWGLTRTPAVGIGATATIADDDDETTASHTDGQILGVAPDPRLGWNASGDPARFYFLRGRTEGQVAQPWPNPPETSYFRAFERQMRDSRWYPRWLVERRERR